MPLDTKGQHFLDGMAAQMAAADPAMLPLDQIPPGTVREVFNGLIFDG